MPKNSPSTIVLRWLQSPVGQAQLDKVKGVPSGRGGPAALVALAIETSGDEGVIAAWKMADQKKVLLDLVKKN